MQHLSFCLIPFVLSSTLLPTSTCNQGPVFAIIGAWLMYQIQNKHVIASDASENLFHKAVIMTALIFILSHFGPIDEWYGIHYSEKLVLLMKLKQIWKKLKIKVTCMQMIWSHPMRSNPLFISRLCEIVKLGMSKICMRAKLGEIIVWSGITMVLANVLVIYNQVLLTFSCNWKNSVTHHVEID